MSARKKRSVRPQAKSLRHRFLHTDVTPEEHKKIQDYCRERRISVSQFFADLMLEEAQKPQAKRKKKVVVYAEIEMTPEEEAKLELLTRLHQKKSVSEYIQTVLRPGLDLQRLHAPAKTRMLRYYVSDEEHDTIMRHIKESGISARNYAAMLALRAIAKDTRKRAH
jgi:hypothetical protein